MKRSEVEKKVTDIFREIFDDKTLVINDETTANDIEGWDSLMHINLIASIEEEFNISFDMSDVISFNNVGDMIDAICKKICK